MCKAAIYNVKGTEEDKQSCVRSWKWNVELAYTARRVVATVVKLDDVDPVVEKMKSALDGEKAVVMISQVNDLVVLYPVTLLFLLWCLSRSSKSGL